MARIVKEHDVRMKEIVLASERLFSENGYDETPVERIIEEVGIAKGTFYHYFRSKEEILDAIIEDIYEEIEEGISRIVKDQAIDPPMKLILIMDLFNRISAGREKLVDLIHEDRNVLLHWKLEKRMNPFLIGHFKDIIEEGRDDKTFDVEDPEMTSMSLLGAMAYIGEAKRRSGIDAPLDKGRMETAFGIMERLLGAEMGLLKKKLLGMEVR